MVSSGSLKFCLQLGASRNLWNGTEDYDGWGKNSGLGLGKHSYTPSGSVKSSLSQESLLSNMYKGNSDTLRGSHHLLRSLGLEVREACDGSWLLAAGTHTQKDLSCSLQGRRPVPRGWVSQRLEISAFTLAILSPELDVQPIFLKLALHTPLHIYTNNAEQRENQLKGRASIIMKTLAKIFCFYHNAWSLEDHSRLNSSVLLPSPNSQTEALIGLFCSPSRNLAPNTEVIWVAW